MFKKFHLHDIFGVHSNQWPRISVSWMVSFLYRFSFMLGWTVLTAIFVNRIGIESLPFLFIGNALLVMCGTMIFSELLRFMKKESLIIFTLLIAATTLFCSATFILPRNEIAFLITSIIGVSLFLGQINILIQLFVEDMFTPIESETAFPLIETSETIGGIVAGIVLTSLGHVIAPYKFLYILIIVSLCIIPTVSIFKNKFHNDLPNLNLKKKEKLREMSKLKRIEEGWEEIKKTGFLQGVVVVILCQFIIFNLVEFQYTKAIQQKVYHAEEHTLIAEETIHLASIEEERTQTLQPTINDSDLEKELTYTLGLFQAVISIFALITQLFIASKVIKKIGIIQSLLIHPLLMLTNFSIMTLRFNISTALISKTGFEMTRSIFQNAYLSSYYSLREEVREEIKEFMEGIIVPLGAIIGTGFIFLFEFLLHHEQITIALNITMLAVTCVMAYVIHSLQKEYTQVSSKALTLVDNTPDKLNAIEILSQKGHKGAVYILIHALENPFEKSIVKIKILEALGRMQKKRAIPTIIQLLDNPNTGIQSAAVTTLQKYENIDKHFYNNAFARLRISKSLKKLFKKKATLETKMAIVEILARINQSDTVEYLVELLQNPSPELKRDCIKVIGNFYDPSSTHFIEEFLSSKNIGIKTAAMQTLWQYGKYKNQIHKELKQLIRSKKENDVVHALRVIGALRLKEFETHVEKLRKSDKKGIKDRALKTLIQFENKNAIKPFVQLLLTSKHSYFRVKAYIRGKKTSKKFRQLVQNELNKQVGTHIHNIFLENNGKILEEFEIQELKQLKHFYKLIEKEKEVMRISEIIDQSIKNHIGKYNKRTQTT